MGRQGSGTGRGCEEMVLLNGRSVLRRAPTGQKSVHKSRWQSRNLPETTQSERDITHHKPTLWSRSKPPELDGLLPLQDSIRPPVPWQV